MVVPQEGAVCNKRGTPVLARAVALAWTRSGLCGKEFLIDSLLVQIHFINEMICGLASRHGSSLFQLTSAYHAGDLLF